MKWLFVCLTLFFMVAPALAGEGPYVAIVGNDISANPFYFGPRLGQFLNDQKSLGVPVCSGGKCEKFSSQNDPIAPEICDATGTRGIQNAETRAGNSGWYEWWIRLPIKPSGEINIVIRCGVIAPNTLESYRSDAIKFCAAETGASIAPGTCDLVDLSAGQSPVKKAALPMITAIAYHGPFNVAFNSFHLTAFRNPGSYSIAFKGAKKAIHMANDDASQVLDGSTSARIMLKACVDKTVVAKLPVSGQVNAAGETEADLEAGDLIYVHMDVPDQNTVNIYCHAQSASLQGVGENPY